MRKILLLVVSSILALSSCSDNKDVYDSSVADQVANANAIPNVDIAEVSNFKMTQKYSVPIQAGKVTVITKGKDTLAITDHAISINIPKSTSVVNQVTSKAKTRGTAAEDSTIDKIVVQYEDVDSLTGYVPGTAITEEETVMMFEDSPINCDYDYNDVILLVKCKKTTDTDGKPIVDIAVKPLAYGAKYNIKFGFDYASVSSTNGNATKTDRSTGIVLSNNVKRDFFDNREMNTTGTYSSVIPLKNYTIGNPFKPTILQLGEDSKTIECIKYDRKSEEKDSTIINKTDTVDSVIVKDINNEGFYQFAPIKVTADTSTIEFFIEPEIPLTYVKNSTYDFNGTTLSGKIKYTSIFSYKLYAGDCDLNASTLIPFGIAIPISSLNYKDNGEDKTFIYWPYESQPIWEGFSEFKNWLNSDNDGSWINKHDNVSKVFEYGGQTWNASVLVCGASYSEMTLPDVEQYATDVVDADQKAQEAAKEQETVTGAELQK
jgi:hypothetical protein